MLRRGNVPVKVAAAEYVVDGEEMTGYYGRHQFSPSPLSDGTLRSSAAMNFVRDDENLND